eukprot:5366385-Pleurochrysis_carterae.AAC.4
MSRQDSRQVDQGRTRAGPGLSLCAMRAGSAACDVCGGRGCSPPMRPPWAPMQVGIPGGLASFCEMR